MVLLTFNVLLDKLLDKTKTQTIRRNRRYRVGDTLHIYWRSPRVKRYHPDHYQLGLGTVIEVRHMKGKEFTNREAWLDGFQYITDLIEALMTRNRMTQDEVLEHEWEIINWVWTSGPHRPPKKEGV